MAPARWRVGAVGAAPSQLAALQIEAPKQWASNLFAHVAPTKFFKFHPLSRILRLTARIFRCKSNFALHGR